MEKLIRFGRGFAAGFIENKITQASAALCYYLTMTFFPLLIVIYAVLGNSYDRFMEILDFAEKLVADDILIFVREYLLYVEQNCNLSMLPLGLTVLMTYASASLRSMHSCIGAIQGGAEYRGIRAFLISFVYSLMLLAVLYFSILVMLTGRSFVESINSRLPNCGFLFGWLRLRYVFLAGIVFMALLGLYHVPKRKEDRYSVLPGAALSTGGIILISPVFSTIIGRSAKYSIVYGSLASLILLMLWLYMCCVTIYSGVVFNVTLYNIKRIKRPQL